MQSISLREFSQFVPVCGERDSVQAAIEMFFRHDCPELVLLDSAQHPKGVVERGALLLSLIPSPPLDHAAAPDLDRGAIATALGEWVEQHALLNPIVTIPGAWAVADLLPHLPNLHRQPWVLVDTSGKLVGLLDRLALLQFLATHPDALSSEAPYPRTGDTLWRATSDQRVMPVALSLMLQLVERLPVPATVQTGRGRIILQNSSWQQQIAPQELLLGWSISTFLNAHGLSSQDGDPAAPAYPATGDRPWSGTPPPPDQDWTASGDRIDALQCAPPSCQIDRESNSCICVYPTPNGAEQSWQFFSIPLNATSSTVAATALWTSLMDAPMASMVPLGDWLSPSSSTPGSGVATGTPWVSPAEVTDLWLIVAQQAFDPPPLIKELSAKNADLEYLNRLKDEFLASLSHELKTPLTAILGLSNLLKSQQLGPLNDRQARYAQLIHQSGRHLVLVVNTILDLTRIETGQMDLSMDALDLPSLCRSAYEQAKQLLLAEEQSGNVSPQLPTDFQLTIHPELVTVIADDVRLRQMLANLLANALKFTPASGTVGLIAEPWDGWMALTVWDTGAGIAPERQPLIFHKVKQVERSAEQRFEGTGLGLVLTQKLAHLHGGEITFTSTPGKGSRFTLLLPWQPSGEGPPEPLSEGTRTEVSRRLAVIVESMPEEVDRLCSHMQQVGYRVAIARSGTEAAEKIRHLRPALVLMNPVLPLLSGWDVLTLLKTEMETRTIPIVLLVSPHDRLRALSSEANAVLNRPTTAQQVQEMIDRLVAAPPQRRLPPTPLTVLYLVPPPTHASLDLLPEELPSPDLNTLLHPYDCRVVEVDDLDQAELLARVWKPNVLLLNGTIPQPLAFFRELQQSDYLAQLPLVTLTADLTEAAHLSGLTVFPCLAPMTPAEGDRIDPPALLQVLQVATMHHRVPALLLADIALLNASSELPPPVGEMPMDHASVQQWLHAFSQYLQTAGFRCYPQDSWDEMLSLLRDRQIDLILLPWHPTRSDGSLLNRLHALANLAQGIPLIVWDCSAEAAMVGQSPLARELKAIATTILPTSLSMAGLVEHLWQMMAQRASDNL